MENVSEYVHSLGEVEGLSKHDTKSIKGITVKYNFINESKASECQNIRLIKLKDKWQTEKNNFHMTAKG